jgi:hypothetical protein
MTSDDISELEDVLNDEENTLLYVNERVYFLTQKHLPELLVMARENAQLRERLARTQEAHATGAAAVEFLTSKQNFLRADLLATRRALKLAQAKGLTSLAGLFAVKGRAERVVRLREKAFRGARLLDHYAAKFEREAGEL